MVLLGMVGVATAQAQTPVGEPPPPAAVEPGSGSGGPGDPGGPGSPSGPVGPDGSVSAAPGADPGASSGLAPTAPANPGPGFGVTGPPLLAPSAPPLAPPLHPLALRRFRTGRALYGVGTALGLVGSGLTLASIVVTAVYGLDSSSGQSTAIIGPSLAYAGSGATGVGFVFSATGLGLQHNALDLIGRDPGRGMYAAGTVFGILGLADPDGAWPAGVQVSDPIAAAQAGVQRLRAQVATADGRWLQAALVEAGRAVGVEIVETDGTPAILRCEREVLVTSGGIGSPRLLLLSGIVVALAGGYLVYGLLRATIGIRLDPEEEYEGADLTIHKITATPDRETHW